MKDEYSLYIEIKQVVQENQSLDALQSQFKKLNAVQLETDSMKKLYSEICYLMALEYLGQGDKEQSRKFAVAAIDNYKKVDTSSLEKSLPILSNILPEIMHEGIVKERILNKID